MPAYNFAVIPHVNARDEWAWRRENGFADAVPEHYEDIEVPLNTPVPLLLGAAAAVFGFAMVWRIWWLALAALIAVFAIVIARSFGGTTGTLIPADEVRRIEQAAGRAARRSAGTVLPEGIMAFAAKTHR